MASLADRNPALNLAMLAGAGMTLDEALALLIKRIEQANALTNQTTP
jgi:hypothetical protein